ncbi:hypothetical protein ACVWZX_005267 [Deinococcus sp. UYEF24]
MMAIVTFLVVLAWVNQGRMEVIKKAMGMNKAAISRGAA